MKFRCSHIALLLFSTLYACTSAQDTKPDTATTRSTEAVAAPMERFARFLGGAWKMTAQSGTSMYDRWAWGPGKHSMRVTTEGEAADGSPWRALRVEYWHPGYKQVRLLSMHPDVPGIGRGVGDGTIRFDGDTVEATVDLYQTRGPRKLLWRSIFTGPDNFRTTLFETNGSDGYQPLTAWDYSRVDESGHSLPDNPDEALRLPDELSVFASLIGHTWDAEGKGEADEGIHVQSSFEYVPLAEYVYGRTVSVAESGTQAHTLDVYLYHHVGTNALRCFALSNSGSVYEGDVTVPEVGALQINVQGYESGGTISRIVRFDLQNDGTLRQRIWSLSGSERILMLDLLHNKIRS